MAIQLKPRSRAKGFVENGRAVEIALRDMAREIGPEKARTQLTRALRASAKPFLRELRKITPVRSGDLKKSSGIRKLPERWLAQFPSRVITAVGVGYWFTKRKDLVYRARARQYGNKSQRQAATRPITKAFEASCGEIQTELNKALIKLSTDGMRRGASGKTGLTFRGRVHARKGKPAPMSRPRGGAF